MVAVTRTSHTFLPDPRRVLAMPFWPGEINFGGDPSRLDLIVERIGALTDDEVAARLHAIEERFAGRHRDIEHVWHEHAQTAMRLSPGLERLSPDRIRLAGMIFTQEYAFEAAAVCNPSMVAVGDPTADGWQEFVMSIRAIGEGHRSSIAFCGGRVSAQGEVELDPGALWADSGTPRSGHFDVDIFRDRLREMRIDNALSERVLESLPHSFTVEDLEAVLAALAHSDIDPALRFETERAMHWLAASNYEVRFGEVPLGERVLSPSAPAESHGMEDARFVRFTEDDGSVRYYGTYTAYDGFEALPQLIETEDFHTFRISTLTGACARSKGIAIFPRRIDGDFVALARTDNESTFVMRSDHIQRWDVAELVLRPTEPWEVVQAGNCGSPIETDEGWLVIMHGVGPMRRYVLSAVLLDLEEPTKVVGRLRQPLLEPDESERNGYVPNVVYSCGGMVHGQTLVLPYGFSDAGIRIATVPLADVLGAME